ncbi:MAG: hypothetical protein JO242_00270, partial [Streptosporangiaceae bacterium]|nr:hypothetical protein [Streptosporangiaceae bacterium]
PLALPGINIPIPALARQGLHAPPGTHPASASFYIRTPYANTEMGLLLPWNDQVFRVTGHTTTTVTTLRPPAAGPALLPRTTWTERRRATTMDLDPASPGPRLAPQHKYGVGFDLLFVWPVHINGMMAGSVGLVLQFQITNENKHQTTVTGRNPLRALAGYLRGTAPREWEHNVGVEFVLSQWTSIGQPWVPAVHEALSPAFGGTGVSTVNFNIVAGKSLPQLPDLTRQLVAGLSDLVGKSPLPAGFRQQLTGKIAAMGGNLRQQIADALDRAAADQEAQAQHTAAMDQTMAAWQAHARATAPGGAPATGPAPARAGASADAGTTAAGARGTAGAAAAGGIAQPPEWLYELAVAGGDTAGLDAWYRQQIAGLTEAAGRQITALDQQIADINQEYRQRITAAEQQFEQALADAHAAAAQQATQPPPRGLWTPARIAQAQINAKAKTRAADTGGGPSPAQQIRPGRPAATALSGTQEIDGILFATYRPRPLHRLGPDALAAYQRFISFMPPGPGDARPRGLLVDLRNARTHASMADVVAALRKAAARAKAGDIPGDLVVIAPVGYRTWFTVRRAGGQVVIRKGAAPSAAPRAPPASRDRPAGTARTVRSPGGAGGQPERAVPIPGTAFAPRWQQQGIGQNGNPPLDLAEWNGALRQLYNEMRYSTARGISGSRLEFGIVAEYPRPAIGGLLPPGGGDPTVQIYRGSPVTVDISDNPRLRLLVHSERYRDPLSRGRSGPDILALRATPYRYGYRLVQPDPAQPAELRRYDRNGVETTVARAAAPGQAPQLTSLDQIAMPYAAGFSDAEQAVRASGEGMAAQQASRDRALITTVLDGLTRIARAPADQRARDRWTPDFRAQTSRALAAAARWMPGAATTISQLVPSLAADRALRGADLARLIVVLRDAELTLRPIEDGGRALVAALVPGADVTRDALQYLTWLTSPVRGPVWLTLPWYIRDSITTDRAYLDILNWDVLQSLADAVYLLPPSAMRQQVRRALNIGGRPGPATGTIGSGRLAAALQAATGGHATLEQRRLLVSALAVLSQWQGLSRRVLTRKTNWPALPRGAGLAGDAAAAAGLAAGRSATVQSDRAGAAQARTVRGQARPGGVAAGPASGTVAGHQAPASGGAPSASESLEPGVQNPGVLPPGQSFRSETRYIVYALFDVAHTKLTGPAGSPSFQRTSGAPSFLKFGFADAGAEIDRYPDWQLAPRPQGDIPEYRDIAGRVVNPGIAFNTRVSLVVLASGLTKQQARDLEQVLRTCFGGPANLEPYRDEQPSGQRLSGRDWSVVQAVKAAGYYTGPDGFRRWLDATDPAQAGGLAWAMKRLTPLTSLASIRSLLHMPSLRAVHPSPPGTPYGRPEWDTAHFHVSRARDVEFSPVPSYFTDAELGAAPYPGGYTGTARLATPQDAVLIQRDRQNLLTAVQQALADWQARGPQELISAQLAALQGYAESLITEGRYLEIRRVAPELGGRLRGVAQALRDAVIAEQDRRRAAALTRPERARPVRPADLTEIQLSTLQKFVSAEQANYTPATIEARIPLTDRTSPRLTQQELTQPNAYPEVLRLRDRLQAEQNATGQEHGYLLARDYNARPGQPVWYAILIRGGSFRIPTRSPVWAHSHAADPNASASERERAATPTQDDLANLGPSFYEDAQLVMADDGQVITYRRGLGRAPQRPFQIPAFTKAAAMVMAR